MLADLVKYEFLRTAILGTTLVSVLSAFVSPIVVYRKMEFIGDGVAHATFAGLAVASILSLSPIPLVTVTSVVFAAFVWYFSKKGKFSESSTIGTLLPVFMALGVITLSKSKSYTTDLSSFLFGNVLLINKSDIVFAFIVFSLTLIFYLFLWKDLIYYLADEKASQFYGINVNLLSLLIMILVSLTVVTTVKISGIILMGTYIVMPGVFAKTVSKNLREILPSSILFSTINSLVGFILAYHFDLPPGPTIALTSFASLAVAILICRR
ncbi:metal ABC transporter permease [Pseudothermotoga thermarum]|nr:metal ABC transporter permease [Pseudothermotoga thermarum]